MQKILKIYCKTQTLQEFHYKNHEYNLNVYICYTPNIKLNEIVIQYFYSLDIDYNKIEEGDLPKINPIFENEFYKIWVIKTNKENITLPRDIARELKNNISIFGGKMTHEGKEAFIEDNFPNHNCNDDEILEQFKELGGKYTDKYLRI